MTTKYRVFKFRFDRAGFCAALQRHVQPDDTKVFAGVIGVDGDTLRNWRNGYHAPGFPHPAMSSFLACCNALDLDPRTFFVLEFQDED